MKVNIYSFVYKNGDKEYKRKKRYVILKDGISLDDLFKKDIITSPMEKVVFQKVIELKLKERNSYIGLLNTKEAIDELEKHGYYFMNITITDDSNFNEIKLTPEPIKFKSTDQLIIENIDKMNNRIDKLEEKIDDILQTSNNIMDYLDENL